ncbi:hypothetical protein GCM10007932_30830 [Vibrio penaeicida]|uniref:Uncharacterized protein n=1 Tax=Vibrio penaeicida TaxID=104609 RepID=A0AAV5NTB6_9VIBR|nr:hypothetical protein GCM10007932_30830 [Vibrio penaeicida]
MGNGTLSALDLSSQYKEVKGYYEREKADIKRRITRSWCIDRDHF